MTFSQKYRFLIVYISTFLFVVFGVSIVFASDLVFSTKVETRALSRNIFVDSLKLKNDIISFTSNYDISKYKIENKCLVKSKFIGKNANKYFYKTSFKKDCNDNDLYLKNDYGDYVQGTYMELHFVKDSDIWGEFLDLKDEEIKQYKENIELKINKISNTKGIDYFSTLANKRTIDEYNHKIKIADKIIEARKQKYNSPVSGHTLSKKESKVPNSPRLYRETYTFGIHEGWDIDAPVGTPVQALDDGIIVRIVSGFKFEDLQKINHKDKSTETKIANLDLLRGNQVWLKTSKGDIVFYSHLDSVSNDLKVGDVVSRGTYFGNIGISGVPDKHYKDSHLHFEIHKNPYLKEKAGKYSFMDYMSWPWYFKGNTAKYTAEHQNEIFK